MGLGDVTVWVVGQYRSGDWPDAVWDLQGVFSSREMAEAACRDRNYWVLPLRLDESLPHETVDAGGYYPLAGETLEGRRAQLQ